MQKVRCYLFRSGFNWYKQKNFIVFALSFEFCFTIRSRYYSLSVKKIYLGLEGGPPIFKKNSVFLFTH